MFAVFYLFYEQFESAQEKSESSGCDIDSSFSFNATDYKKELNSIWESYGTSIIVSGKI